MYPRIELSGLDSGSSSCGETDPFASTDIAADGKFFSSLPRDTTFYIVRHGQSEGNATLTFQGRLDYPLDARGLEQAKAAAAWLAEKKVDAVVSSPQRRASVTASIIAKACGRAEPLLLPSLVEVDVGIFSAIDMDTARLRYPEIFSEFRYRSWDAVPEAEHSPSMYRRAISSWMRMRDLAIEGAKTIVCVSHGGLIQWLIRSTFGVKTWLPLIPSSNCGISQFDVEPTGYDLPAFTQWPLINFRAPDVGVGIKPTF